MKIERTSDWTDEPEDAGGSFLIGVAPFPVVFDEFWDRDSSRDLALFGVARELVDDGHNEAAVAVAQTALEISADWAFRMALRISVPEAVVDPFLNVIPDRTS